MGGNIPWTGQPRVHDHEAHVSFLYIEAPLGLCLPVPQSKNRIKYEVQFDMIVFESKEKSKCVTVEVCPFMTLSRWKFYLTE